MRLTRSSLDVTGEDLSKDTGGVPNGAPAAPQNGRRASAQSYTGTRQLHSWFPRPPRVTQMLLRESRANHIAMEKGVASVVICEACGERVAEIVADDGRALCSRCHLTEGRAKTPREEKPDPDQ